MVDRLALVGLLVLLQGCLQTVGVTAAIPTVYQPPEPLPVSATSTAPSPDSNESHKHKAPKAKVVLAKSGDNARVTKRSEPPSKSTTASAGLVPGSAAYQIPTIMIENESSPVDLWIDASLTRDEISQRLGSFLRENADRAAKRRGEVKTKVIGTTQIEEIQGTGVELF